MKIRDSGMAEPGSISTRSTSNPVCYTFGPLLELPPHPLAALSFGEDCEHRLPGGKAGPDGRDVGNLWQQGSGILTQPLLTEMF